MDWLDLFGFGLFALVAGLAVWSALDHPSDRAAIRRRMSAQGLKVRRIHRHRNLFRYQLGGRPWLNGLSRLYIAFASQADGEIVEQHFAFDPFDGEIELLKSVKHSRRAANRPGGRGSPQSAPAAGRP